MYVNKNTYMGVGTVVSVDIYHSPYSHLQFLLKLLIACVIKNQLQLTFESGFGSGFTSGFGS